MSRSNTDVRLREFARALDELCGHGAQPCEPGRVHEPVDGEPTLLGVPLALGPAQHPGILPRARSTRSEEVPQRLQIGVVDRAGRVHERPIAVEEAHPNFFTRPARYSSVEA